MKGIMKDIIVGVIWLAMVMGGMYIAIYKFDWFFNGPGFLVGLRWLVASCYVDGTILYSEWFFEKYGVEQKE